MPVKVPVLFPGLNNLAHVMVKDEVLLPRKTTKKAEFLCSYGQQQEARHAGMHNTEISMSATPSLHCCQCFCSLGCEAALCSVITTDEDIAKKLDKLTPACLCAFVDVWNYVVLN